VERSVHARLHGAILLDGAANLHHALPRGARAVQEPSRRMCTHPSASSTTGNLQPCTNMRTPVRQHDTGSRSLALRRTGASKAGCTLYEQQFQGRYGGKGNRKTPQTCSCGQ
jgi:hypothetical protein